MDSYSYYFLFPKSQTHTYTRFENGCGKNSTQKLLTKYSTEEQNKHGICRPRSVRIGKNCALGLEYSRLQPQFFPIRTSRLANNIYVLTFAISEHESPFFKRNLIMHIMHVMQFWPGAKHSTNNISSVRSP